MDLSPFGIIADPPIMYTISQGPSKVVQKTKRGKKFVKHGISYKTVPVASDVTSAHVPLRLASVDCGLYEAY